MFAVTWVHTIHQIRHKRSDPTFHMQPKLLLKFIIVHNDRVRVFSFFFVTILCFLKSWLTMLWNEKTLFLENRKRGCFWKTTIWKLNFSYRNKLLTSYVTLLGSWHITDVHIRGQGTCCSLGKGHSSRHHTPCSTRGNAKSCRLPRVLPFLQKKAPLIKG